MKIRLFILLSVWSTISIVANSDTSAFCGQVVRKDSNQALEGVSIYFPDLKMGTITNKNGNFCISHLPSAKVLIEIKMVGYQTQTLEVDLKSKEFHQFQLEISVLELKEVLITGGTKATAFKENPLASATIKNNQLQENSSSNIIDALQILPGLSALNSGPNVSKPSIRGLGGNRVLTMFDGVRQDGQQWGEEHGVEIDQFLIDRIEVIKGPASLLYGSDALAGVINLIPKNPAPAGSVKGHLINNYQSNNHQIANSLFLQGNKNGISWSITGSHKQAMDYQNKIDGRVYGTKFNENDLNANIGVYKSWGYSYVNCSYFNSLQEIPDGSRDSATRKFTHQINEIDGVRGIVSNGTLNSYNIDPLHQNIQHFRIYSANNFNLGKNKLAFKAGLQQSTRQEMGHPEFTNIPALSLQLRSYTYDLKFYFKEWKGWENTIGLNGVYQQNKNVAATEFVIPNYQSFDIGPFIHFEKSIQKFHLSGGVRYDYRYFSNDAMYTTINANNGFSEETPFDGSNSNLTKQFSAYSNHFKGLSASFGSTYNPNKNWCFKSNIARGYRAPNIAEISALGVHPGTGFQQLGDANLKPEFSEQIDLGIFHSDEHISFSIELFANRIENYIFNQKLNSVLGGDSIFHQGGNDYSVYQFHQTTSLLYGGEISVDIHPHPLHWLHIENSASFVNALNLGGNGVIISDSTKYLPFIPPFHSNTELRAEIPNFSKYFSNVYFKCGIQFYATQNRIYSANNTETKTNGYYLIDAGLGTKIKNTKGNSFMELIVSANNITDVAYQSNMSRLKYMDNYPNNYTGKSGIYAMGRNISVKVIVPLNIKKAT